MKAPSRKGWLSARRGSTIRAFRFGSGAVAQTKVQRTAGSIGVRPGNRRISTSTAAARHRCGFYGHGRHSGTDVSSLFVV